jgi:hypothetical protein
MLPFLDLEDCSRRARRRLRDFRFVTTPSSYFNRLTGQEAFTDGIMLSDGSVFSPGSGGTIVAIAAATTTLALTAALHGGRVLSCAPTGGLAVTPPAATGTGVSYIFLFTAAITGGSFTFDAKAGQASDLIYGLVNTYKATTYTQYDAAPTVANANLITLDGSTRGGAGVCDWFEIKDVGLHLWLVKGGFFIQSGTIATPFTNH